MCTCSLSVSLSLPVHDLFNCTMFHYVPLYPSLPHPPSPTGVEIAILLCHLVDLIITVYIEGIHEWVSGGYE